MAGKADILNAELALIQGLQGHTDLSDQAIVALFSTPDRTISHNSIGEIRQHEPLPFGRKYPTPATVAECDAFLASVDYLNLGQRRLSVAAAMNKPVWRFSYSFHPVGQGLFSSGTLTRQARRDFNWVYDCGTTQLAISRSRRAALVAEIDALEAVTPKRRSRAFLDLVTISHFDADHVGGLLVLLDRFDIGTLLIPYLTPWQRLIVIIQQGAAIGSDLYAFLQSPTAFLQERAGDRIDQILLVGSGSGDGSPDGAALPPPEPDPEREPERGLEDYDGGKLVFKPIDPPVEDDGEALGADHGTFAAPVYSLPAGNTLTLDRLWEFVPYNDASLRHLVTPRFKARAQPLVDRLRNTAGTAADRKLALAALIALYDRRFKTRASKQISPERRNRISLFLYSGPIGDVQLMAAAEHRIGTQLFEWSLGPSSLITENDRFGLMLTGDGYLHSPTDITAFSKFFTPYDRLSRGAVFQVMHHGAKGNWQFGLGRRIDPLVSVFSSNPFERPNHPHTDVVRDFASHSPKQVDRRDGWRVDGQYIYL